MTFEFSFSHPAPSVFDLLTNREFVIRRCLAMDSIEAECQVSESENTTTVDIDRTQKSDIPSLLKKVMGETQSVNIKEVWFTNEDSYRCSAQTQIKGAPLTVALSKKLRPTSVGCQYSARVTAKSGAPLIGKKLEKMVQEKTPQALLEECQYLQDYLDQNY